MIIDGKKLPDFLIVGAAKSGTSSIFHYLKEHPDIFLPEIKESYFFSLMDNNLQFKGHDLNFKITDKNDYIDQFAFSNPNHVLGDVCPFYLYSHIDTIKNIKKIYKDSFKKLKIVIILRNPSDRSYSHYNMHIKEGTENLTFTKAINPVVVADRLNSGWNWSYDYVGFSMYYSQVKSFMDEFNHIKIYLYEDLQNNKTELIYSLLEFLGVNKIKITNPVRYNVSGNPRLKFLHEFLSSDSQLKEAIKMITHRLFSKKQIHKYKSMIYMINMKKNNLNKSLKTKLIYYFEDDINNLEKLIGRDLSMWLKID